jgi:hypothetical protein
MSKVKDVEREKDEKFMGNLPIVGKKPSGDKEENYLREVCEYEFYNLEEPGLAIKFPYGSTRNSHNFTFYHGTKYKVPRHVARHLESCSTPIWDWRPDGTGKMTKQRVGEKPRFQMRHVFA